MGPDYVRPDTPVPEVWSSDLTRGLTSETMDPNVLASWWTTLGDPVLSRLIELAVEGNLDIATARSRVRQARAQRQIVQGGLLPGFNAGVSATSSRVDRRNGFDTSG